MTVLLAISLVGNVAVVHFFLRHIRETKRADDLRTSSLLNRIQAPEVAVVQARIDEGDGLKDAYVPYDDDAAYWAAKQER